MITHNWNVSIKEATALQKELAGKVVQKNNLGKVTTIAGIDVGFPKLTAQSAIVVMDYPSLKVLDYVTATLPITTPYIPGFLSFREGPVILEAIRKLPMTPDLLIFDGQGIAHPRRLGIASHLGVLLDLPSIGCAKSRLCGHYEEPLPERGNYTPLIDKGEIIAAVLRTRTGVKPVFVSVGHRLDLPASIEYILSCCTKYRLPEPIRQAHLLTQKVVDK